MAWKNIQYENGKMRTSSGGGGGGSSTFADLEDVDLSNLQDGQVPKYNSSTQKWENANESGGSGHTYSTTEQVVGTWIDGKPLYEITMEFSSSVITNWGVTPMMVSAYNIKQVINCVAWDVNNTSIPCAASINDTYVKLSFTYGGSGYLNAIGMTIQYTKTTD